MPWYRAGYGFTSRRVCVFWPLRMARTRGALNIKPRFFMKAPKEKTRRVAGVCGVDVDFSDY